MRSNRLAPICVAVCLGSASAHGQQLAASITDLSRLSIDELANLPVTGVTRTLQPVSQSPAAIYVITNDDIRRSGAVTLAEALRLAPNLYVARADAATYGISARGFNHNSATADKLQVMIDGRIVYTPLYSGVFWDEQDVPLADIDRIEVISGPGGALWGSNAVNGVINIVTRSAQDTLGGLVDVSAGTLDQRATVQYGSKLSDDGALRVYLKGLNPGRLQTATGSDALGSWDSLRAGFRTDWSVAANAFTLEGDIFRGTVEPPPGAALNNAFGGGNVLGRWTRTFADQSSLQTQVYYWRDERRTTTGIRSNTDVYDLDAQYSFDAGPIGSFVVGGGYRLSNDEFLKGPNTVFLSPQDRTLRWANGFIQDQLPLTDAVTLTLGLKLESNSYTGTEYMPDVRLSWRASSTDFLWAAVSRAARTPSRFDRDLINPGIFAGGPDFTSEDVVAYELGYRAQPTTSLSFSISAFYNVYDNLRSVEFSTPAGFPLQVRNGMKGNTFGIEMWGNYALTDWWRLSAGLSTLHKDLRFDPGVRDPFGVRFAGNDPAYQAQLRSSMDLLDSVQLDLFLRAVDDLPAPRVPGYFEADMRIGWRLTPSLELAIVGSNLLQARHTEFVNPSIPAQEIPRSVSATARWLF